MIDEVSAGEAKRRIHGDDELAVLDVREHGQYGEGHLLFASNCPYSRIEIEAPRLVPNRGTPCIIYDDGDGVARRAAERLTAIGYSQISILHGGAAGWAAAGFHLFKGVNVPSKAFGELVESVHHTPTITADQVEEWREAGRELFLFDGRPMTDFTKMSIPGARCVPNGELLYRFDKLVHDSSTPIVINCAGRTRGLIGAQSLISAGVRNPVFALENGTQGWALSGRKLDRGRISPPLPEPSPANVAQGRDLALRLAAAFRIPVVDSAEIVRWRHDPRRTLYLLDVRTEDEYVDGHVAGARHAPAVQLVQATDEWVAVRRAKLVLIDDNGVRATMAAAWLRQMGHDAVVVRNALSELETADGPDAPALDESIPMYCERISAKDLVRAERSGMLMLDLRSSRSHRQRRIPQSRWTTRARLNHMNLSEAVSIVLIADDPVIAQLAAYDIRSLTAVPIFLLDGGLDGWIEAGGSVEASPDEPSDAEAIDFLTFVHDRHQGNLEASRQYLAWETGLVEELDAMERAEFDPRVPEGAQL